MLQIQSSMHTHYHTYEGKSNEDAKVLLYAPADETLVAQGISEDEEPIETRLSLYINDPCNFSKADYENHSRRRRTLRSSTSRAMRHFRNCSGDNSRPIRSRDQSGSNIAQIRENDSCLGCNSIYHVLVDRK